MDLLTLVFCAIIGIVILTYAYFKWKFSYWKNRGVPHLEPKFPFGNLVDMKDTVILDKKVIELYNMYKDKSPVVGFYFFASPTAIVTDLELVKNVLIKDFNIFHDRGLYSNETVDPLSGHLFLLEGSRWKNLRSKLSPTFTSGKMKFMFPTIVEVGQRLGHTLSEIVSNEEDVEIKEIITRFTTDIIGICAFGIECNSLKDPKAEFRMYGKKIFTEPAAGPLGLLIRSSFQSLARLFRMKNFKDDVSEFFIDAVKKTVEYRENNNIRRNDFMDLLIQLKNTGQLEDNSSKFIGKLTLNEIAAQAFVFFLAGFETSGSVMTFCLFELAMNRDIQDKVREEIQRVLEKHNKKFTYEAMMEMTYLEQVINETLRKYPTLNFLFRKAREDYNVPNSDKIIEKNTRVIIPVHAIHHDPDLYPNPDVFDPERFSPEDVKTRHSQSYLPFGDGPRNCIGMRFGQTQTRVGLVTLLQNFTIDLSPKLHLPLNFTYDNFITTLPDGMWLKFKKIK